MGLLISNDDGVYASGLNALYQPLKSVSVVEVVFPYRTHSGASNALILENPLRIQHLSNGFIAINDTPTDCVHLALNELSINTPELVISDLNNGANMEDDLLCSGTVAAVKAWLLEWGIMFLPLIITTLIGRGLRFFLVVGLKVLGGKQMEAKLSRTIDILGWITITTAVILYLMLKY